MKTIKRFGDGYRVEFAGRVLHSGSLNSCLALCRMHGWPWSYAV